MPEVYADDFLGIPGALASNADLRNSVLKLMDRESIAGKVTEGGNRMDRFRSILKELAGGKISLPDAYAQVERDLPRNSSVHGGDNRVFPANWAERLVRTQLSRFYNQAVMETLLARGETKCFVPHSAAEDATSACSTQLAGATHDLKTLHNRLVESYGAGNWGKDVKIPNHPHCTHVVKPKAS